MQYNHENLGIRLMMGTFIVDLFESSGYERYDHVDDIYFTKKMPDSILVFNSRVSSNGRLFYNGLPITSGFTQKPSFFNSKNGFNPGKTSTDPVFLEMQNNTERMLEKIRLLISKQERIGRRLTDQKLMCEKCNHYFISFSMDANSVKDSDKKECFCSFYS